MPEFITITTSNQIATILLNRPEKNNAMHGPFIQELLSALKQLAQQDLRLLIIRGNGKHFCAGGDIAWMQKMVLASESENYQDAQWLADLLYQLATFPKPTLVLAQGLTLGGGLGLIAAADIAIASSNALFGLPEVNIGLIPSVISPYVMACIGERQAHYYFLTGERFTADQALRIGLIHKVTQDHELLNVGQDLAELLIQKSPQALALAKKLIARIAKEKITVTLSQQTAKDLATLRVTEEAQEGLTSFLEKRKPNWIK